MANVELARLGNVNQPQITQIMDLATVALDFQEELLGLYWIQLCSADLAERHLLPKTMTVLWSSQTQIWRGRTEIA